SYEWEASDQAGTSPAIRVRVVRDAATRYITGEASANTFHDVAPSLLHQYLPDVRLILLIRNPIDRAYSHHGMYRRFQAAGHQVGFAVRDFESDISAELAAWARGEPAPCLAPGIYVDQLQRWVSAYGWGHLRVILTEELADMRQAQAIMHEL